jgi:hypothetical protein
MLWGTFAQISDPSLLGKRCRTCICKVCLLPVSSVQIKNNTPVILTGLSLMIHQIVETPKLRDMLRDPAEVARHVLLLVSTYYSERPLLSLMVQ